jgi:hypothetical protein
MDYAMEYDLDAANIAAAQVRLPRRRTRRSVPRRARAELSIHWCCALALVPCLANRVRNGPTRQCAELRKHLCTIGGRGGGGSSSRGAPLSGCARVCIMLMGRILRSGV